MTRPPSIEIKMDGSKKELNGRDVPILDNFEASLEREEETTPPTEKLVTQEDLDKHAERLKYMEENGI